MPLPCGCRWVTVALAVVAIAIPAGVFVAMPRAQPAIPGPELYVATNVTFPPSELAFEKSSLGGLGYRPQITHVQIVDLDNNGIPGVLACDARRNRVIWYRQAPRGVWVEHVLGDRDLPAPCHATVVPGGLFGSGKPDIVVGVLGSVWPTNDHVGSVVWLENRGNGEFITHVILDDLGRVVDVEVGDLKGDGRLDIAVAEFGSDTGRVLWLENKGNGKFLDHELFTGPGPIHVPLADFNGDGKLDIMAVVSQDYEEVWAFENLGGGQFRKRLIASNPNFDFGSAGLIAVDLDRDGKTDLLWYAGDNLEIRYPAPQRWHGCYWLRNMGDWKFEAKRIGTLAGTYAAAAGDFRGTGNNDVVLVGMFNDWHRPSAASVVLLENDGKMNFTERQIASSPTHLATVAAGDLNGDGRADIVAGGFHILEPYDRLGRITLWTSKR